MARVIYIRVDAAHAARTNLQQFALLALRDAVDRWRPLTPPVAEAACDESFNRDPTGSASGEARSPLGRG